MKTIAYYALHYGKEWLGWSMRAIRPLVDEIVVVYTPTPSFGHGTNIQCPDSEEELRAIAEKYDVEWIRLSGSHWEGDHRDEAVDICIQRGADIIVPIDHDEIIEPATFEAAEFYASVQKARNYRIAMQHYWRSVKWVCYDEAMPVRFINVNGEGDGYIPREYGNVHHFGYAQSPKLMHYKWEIHGHLAELRDKWFRNTFLAWQPGMGDVHPTNVDFWNPVEFDRNKLAYLIDEHPYFHLDIIQ